VDRDGWTDLATGSGYLSPYAQEIRVWQNDRSPFSGTWASNQVVHIVDDVRSVTLADLDNDGRLDIVARYDELTWGRIGMWRNPERRGSRGASGGGRPGSRRGRGRGER